MKRKCGVLVLKTWGFLSDSAGSGITFPECFEGWAGLLSFHKGV